MINENSSIREIKDFIVEYGPTQIGEDPKSTIMSTRELNDIIMKACERENALAPGFCFNTVDEAIEYACKKYFEDRKEYQSSGVWPKRGAWQRCGHVWLYYYYLQISDFSLNLNKYLDFDYDTNKWTRNELVKLINKYGKNVLHYFSFYIHSLTDKSFDEWYESEESTFYKDFADHHMEEEKTTSK